MNNHSPHVNPPDPSPIRLSCSGHTYWFRGWKSGDVLFGNFDTLDESGSALDFSQRNIYLPLKILSKDLKFSSLRQVHGTHIKQVPPNMVPFHNHGEGDVLFTLENQEALTIRTADCLPLFLFNEDFILLAHVGYRGLLDGILDRITKEIKPVSNKPWHGAIGPHIESCCFEVNGEVLKEFDAFKLCSDRDIIGPEDYRFVSLKSIVQRWFRQITRDRMCFDFSVCTHCHTQYHSYRRSRTPFRQGNLIMRSGRLSGPVLGVNPNPARLELL